MCTRNGDNDDEQATKLELIPRCDKRNGWQGFSVLRGADGSNAIREDDGGT